MEKIIKLSFLTYIILFILFFFIEFGIDKNNYVVFVNFITALIFFSLLLSSYKKENYHLKNLLLITFIYSTFFVLIYNILFYLDSSTFFEFGAVDSLEYDNYALSLSKMPFEKRISALLNGYGKNNFDDMGFTTYVSFLYQFTASNLLVNFLNIILTLISSYLLFKLSSQFLSIKGAYLSSLIYAISSYTVYLQASGLKEILMNTIIIFSFYAFYKYLSTKSMIMLIYAVLAALLILFFRIPITLFLLASFGSFYFLGEKGFVKKIFFTSVIISIAIFILFELLVYMNKYLLSYSDIVYYNTLQDDFTGLPPLFSGIISYVVGFAGPFPTLISRLGYESLSIYAPSLTLKVFLFIPFLFGTLQIIKRKSKYFYPLVFFTLYEIITISFLWESFELRKVFPHFPYFFIIVVYYFEKNYNKNNIFLRASYFGVPLLIFIWNYLR